MTRHHNESAVEESTRSGPPVSVSLCVKMPFEDFEVNENTIRHPALAHTVRSANVLITHHYWVLMLVNRFHQNENMTPRSRSVSGSTNLALKERDGGNPVTVGDRKSGRTICDFLI